MADLACQLTSRSSGRVQRQRPAAPGNKPGAPLNSRSVRPHEIVACHSAFFSCFSPPRLAEFLRVADFPRWRFGAPARFEASARGTFEVSQQRWLRRLIEPASDRHFEPRFRSGSLVVACGRCASCGLTSRSSGRVGRARSASRVSSSGAPLSSRSVSFQGTISAGEAFSISLLSPLVTASLSVWRCAKSLSSSRRHRLRLHADRRTSLSVGGISNASGWPAQLTSCRGAARATWCYPRNIVDLKSKQALERTRGASSIRFAGQQFWRAAQLQIR